MNSERFYLVWEDVICLKQIHIIMFDFDMESVWEDLFLSPHYKGFEVQNHALLVTLGSILHRIMFLQ